MIVKLLTERHLEFLSLKGGCTGSSESTLVKMSNFWKSRALALIFTFFALSNRAIVVVYSSTCGIEPWTQCSARIATDLEICL